MENSGIYSAIYSGVHVFEMLINDIAVMRRRHDSYLNATQILKVAGIDKGKRTKILEKEILTGEHEKVQGGYGKYQGTWVPFQRGVQFCADYGVQDSLRPLLELDTTSTVHGTPTKEQAMAARRKNMYGNNRQKIRSAAYTYDGNSPYTDGANAAKTALKGRNNQTPEQSYQTNRHMTRPLGTPTHSNYMSTIHEEQGFAQPHYSNIPPKFWPQRGLNSDYEPPRKRIRHTIDQTFEDQSDVFSMTGDANSHPFFAPTHVEPFGDPQYLFSKNYMTELFMREDLNTTEQVLAYLNEEDVALDVHIDQVGHSALHWAAALARVSVAEALIRKGASPIERNFSGETPLIRAVNVTNSHEQDAFPKLLEILCPALPLADHQERTVLHQIAITAGMHNRSAVASSYLNSIIRWLVEHKDHQYGLERFSRDVVNRRDINGDTALNIAARVGNAKIVQQLIEIGADPKIQNKAQLCAEDFGFPGLMSLSLSHQIHRSYEDSIDGPPPDQNSRGIIESISQALSELDERYKQEVIKHDNTINQVHSQVREITNQLKEARNQAASLEQKSNRLHEAERRKKQFELRIQQIEENFHSQVNGQVNGWNYTGPIDPDAPFKEELAGEPTVERLKVLIQAYQKVVDQLKITLGGIEEDHRVQEARLRGLVARCTNIPDEKIDGLIDELLEAVESDLPLDQDRFDKLASNLELQHNQTAPQT
ncbi:Start control protein cdc10 [Neolecta irregularis DAH-3]|uniref:Start control protein cdc10 n=1 Tax=Neolecta irregularis (strain DAH-3) TaxID=1198029 RepID=A0A1U7LWL1_NEOID|nr:Start control protein cdc10 [Neolecta irregularis DAH-3]|eukprot:OLL27024.1 Start control protein cdc10 [Neolecta irregularis DAH-3]